MLTSLIDAFEQRDVAIMDIPGALLNSKFDDNGVLCMKIEGTTVEMMVEIAQDVYGPYLYKGTEGKSVLVVQVTKGIYGYVKSSMLF